MGCLSVGSTGRATVRHQFGTSSALSEERVSPGCPRGACGTGWATRCRRGCWVDARPPWQPCPWWRRRLRRTAAAVGKAAPRRGVGGAAGQLAGDQRGAGAHAVVEQFQQILALGSSDGGDGQIVEDQNIEPSQVTQNTAPVSAIRSERCPPSRGIRTKRTDPAFLPKT